MLYCACRAENLDKRESCWILKLSRGWETQLVAPTVHVLLGILYIYIILYYIYIYLSITIAPFTPPPCHLVQLSLLDRRTLGANFRSRKLRWVGRICHMLYVRCWSKVHSQTPVKCREIDWDVWNPGDPSPKMSNPMTPFFGPDENCQGTVGPEPQENPNFRWFCGRPHNEAWKLGEKHS